MKDFLSPIQISELKLAHRVQHKKRLADRIKIILALNNGLDYKQIEGLFLIDDSTIRRYEKAYQEEGLESLLKLSYQGGLPFLSQEDEQELKGHLACKTYKTALEIQEYINKKYHKHFCLSGVRYLLYRLGFTYKKPKVIPGCIPSRKVQESFVNSYKKLADNLSPDEKIYFVDGCHPTHNSVASYGWILKGQDNYLKTNSGRSRMNLHGALNIEKGEIIFEESDSIHTDSAINLFRKIIKKNTNKKKIYIILDNARYYHSRKLKSWVKKTRIQLIFLPPYCPNLNLIERFWKFLRKKVLYNKYYEKYTLFRKAIHQFLNSMSKYKRELKTLLAPNFQIINSA